ncbi:uncharacterized protein LOC128269381 isoform X3 [Anopheles cruzii]|uniref:uncharacterized protein LOC128269381 isoform X3 n=1 Tax=Anopheles cruzii TaxID=68878 RepID=UPI0022EC59C2|nr:uncharacterized protein LOC128269381 isoform X3 [Anopheles cruzii]XP_052862790.1 uncharacterized protein LOC128269381 isoform X3 [Anopheles cruzii]
MATMQRRLVHKQFNSPINLYSQKNIQETLDRELKVLSNGAMGIDFDDPSTTKPPSLAKSAVLAALEDEERQKSRGTGLKRVAWPPPAEGGEYEVHPSQQKQAVGQQIPLQQQQQPPQQFYHQPVPQQQQQQQQQHLPHPTYQPSNVHQQHQQQQPPHRPVERIIPIQRATSIQSPIKSPVNQPKYPAYPQQQHAAPNRGGSSTVSFSGGRAVPPNQSQPRVTIGYGGSPSPRSPGIPVGSPRSPGTTLGGSPRGWSHVASPVPTYRPSPQPTYSSPVQPPFYQQTRPAQYQQPHQQQQQPQQQGYQVFVPPPLVAQPVQIGPHGGAAPWYGARKPEDQQQPLAPQYQHLLQQQHTYQPQPTEAFQPLTGQQQQQPPTPSARTYQPIQPPQQQQQQLPPTLVTTLRKEPPMSQEPAPVYQTQPVAAIYQGGSNMRGDQKWPPEEYKRQSEVDNEERRRLAQEPAFRPRRQQKDYAGFFAKNALNNTYPGYRAPPGTQHHA